MSVFNIPTYCRTMWPLFTYGGGGYWTGRLGSGLSVGPSPRSFTQIGAPSGFSGGGDKRAAPASCDGKQVLLNKADVNNG